MQRSGGAVEACDEFRLSFACALSLCACAHAPNSNHCFELVCTHRAAARKKSKNVIWRERGEEVIVG